MTAPSFSPQVTIPQWLELPHPIRMKLADLFKLTKSTGVSVQNNTVVCDGYTHEDLKGISAEKMAEYTGRKPTEDFFFLLNTTVGKIYDDELRVSSAKIQDAQFFKERTGKEKAEALVAAAKEVEEYASVLLGEKPKRGRPKKV